MMGMLQFLVPLALIVATACSAAHAAYETQDVAGDTYTNPVGGEIRMGDPFVLLHEGAYYLYGTTARDGFRCWRSPDLVHWTELGYAYRRAEDSWGTGSFWAPEVFRYRGLFYMGFSCQREKEEGFRLCLAVSEDPAGPFRDLHGPWCDIGWSCIDAHVFVDDDGTPYLYFAQVGVVENATARPRQRYIYGKIHGLRLKEDLSGPAGEPVLCAEADQEWEDPESVRVRCNEGAFVLKHAGRYYMTYSATHYASPRYGIGYATAESPLGPWTKSDSNPLARTDPEKGVSGPGHNSFTTSPDGREVFMVYHAHADPEHPSGNRTVNIDRVVFDEDGRMRLIGPTRTHQPMPSGAPESP